MSSGGSAKVNPNQLIQRAPALHPDAEPDPTDPTRSQFREGLARLVFRTPNASAAPAAPAAPAASSGAGGDAGAGEDAAAEDGANAARAGDNVVFYNKAQVVNRDLSVLSIRAFAKLLPKEAAAREAEKEKRKEDQARREVANRVRRFGETPEEAAKVVLAKAEEEAKRRAERKAAREASAAEAGSKESAATEGAGEQKKPRRKRAGDDGIIDVYEGLSASGLRALRYAAEIPELTSIVANDISPDAITAMHDNIEANSAAYPAVRSKVRPRHGDCSQGLLQAAWSGEKFACVDLDPYGSPIPFIDAAVQGVADDGLMCVTATDMAVLAGAEPKACFLKYGSVPTRGGPFVHEMALRILLYSIAMAAGRHRRGIEPLLSVHIDFYIRVFVRVREGALPAVSQAENVGMLLRCSACPWYRAVPFVRMGVSEGGKFRASQIPSDCGPRCGECGSPVHQTGPMWIGPIHSNNFVDSVVSELDGAEAAAAVEGAPPCHFASARRLRGMLGIVRNEVPNALFVQCPSYICHFVHAESIPLIHLQSALANAGYTWSDAQTREGAIKTDAPPEFVMDVVRSWAINESPIKRKLKGPPSFFLEREIRHKVDFTLSREASASRSKAKGARRFCENPEGYRGGPLAVAKRKKVDNNNSSSSNNGKNKNGAGSSNGAGNGSKGNKSGSDGKAGDNGGEGAPQTTYNSEGKVVPEAGPDDFYI